MSSSGMSGRRTPTLRRAATGAVLVALVVAMSGCSSQVADTPKPSELDPAVDARGPVSARGVDTEGDGSEPRAVANSSGDVVPEPVAVRIPAIDVDATVVPVGLNVDRSMEVPDFGQAGWYTEGPRPGAPGPSVIVAHYDSRSGPDVFHALVRLVPGDEIHVLGDDGSEVTFIVESREQRPKDELPGERIWAASSHPRLTLVTCGGVFDRATGHYLDNVIVYAVGA